MLNDRLLLRTNLNGIDAYSHIRLLMVKMHADKDNGELLAHVRPEKFLLALTPTQLSLQVELQCPLLGYWNGPSTALFDGCAFSKKEWVNVDCLVAS